MAPSETRPDRAVELISGDARTIPVERSARRSTNFDRALLNALQRLRRGDFSIRLPENQTGVAGTTVAAVNDLAGVIERMAQQLELTSQVFGREGKVRQRVKLGLSNGTWGDMEASINTLIDDLLWPTSAVTHAITAVARGSVPKNGPLALLSRLESRRNPRHRRCVPSLVFGHCGWRFSG